MIVPYFARLIADLPPEFSPQQQKQLSIHDVVYVFEHHAEKDQLLADIATPFGATRTISLDYIQEITGLKLEYIDVTSVCIKTFFAEEEGDLTIRRGDIVTFINYFNGDPSSEWAIGMHSNSIDGQTGIYPINHTVTLGMIRDVAKCYLEQYQKTDKNQSPVPTPSATTLPNTPKSVKIAELKSSSPEVEYLIPAGTITGRNSSPSTLPIAPDRNISLNKSDEVKTFERRLKILQELTETEKNLATEFTNLYEHFVFPLIQNTISPMKEKIKTYFGNLNQVAKLSTYLSDCFQYEYDNFTKDNQIIPLTNICNIFNHSEAKIKSVFSDYTNTHSAQENFSKDSDIVLQINQSYDRSKIKTKHTANLAWILIKPVQRLMKYPLFINQLIRTFSDDSEVKRNLENCLKFVTMMIDNVNETKRRKEEIGRAHV